MASLWVSSSSTAVFSRKFRVASRGSGDGPPPRTTIASTRFGAMLAGVTGPFGRIPLCTSFSHR